MVRKFQKLFLKVLGMFNVRWGFGRLGFYVFERGSLLSSCADSLVWVAVGLTCCIIFGVVSFEQKSATLTILQPITHGLYIQTNLETHLNVLVGAISRWMVCQSSLTQISGETPLLFFSPF